MRRLFSQWQLLNTQLRQLKAQAQGVLVDNGISDPKLGRRMVDNPVAAQQVVATLELSPASAFSVTMSLGMLATLAEQKKKLQREIYRTGQPFDEQVRLLIGIRGVTPLLALGYGRARIAVLRKTFGMMRRMLLPNTQYRWKEEALFESKLRDCMKIRDSEEKPNLAA